MDEKGVFHLCPVFDNGAALLSDTVLDYPLGENICELLGTVKAKTLCNDFDEQLDAAEKLYGQPLRFSFHEKDIKQAMDAEPYYPQELKQRVLEILRIQKRKYAYLFLI